MPRTLEILAPAGDQACLDAALNAGADAVYFGLETGFNARARATNFALASLPTVINKIHDHGCRGYLTINTLVFDAELPELEGLVTSAAAAGVDAVIVQDLGVARLIQGLVPTLRLHASTQMTCTDIAAVQFASNLGLSRVTLARELSLREITEIVQACPIQCEVFAHGALCIAYSGQCLTSEAMGGRSANRGACAQACRLPFELVVDGELRNLDDVTYLLSPKDLDASSRVPELLQSGIAAIKIEGRLKGPEYVAATTRLYRLAVDAAANTGPAPTQHDRELCAQIYSRGASLGFLQGVDHQTLVNGKSCDHIGIEVGRCLGNATRDGKSWLRLRTQRELKRGDGILVQGSQGDRDELGGRIWMLAISGRDVESAEGASEIWVWLGPDRKISGNYAGRLVFRTSSASLESELGRLHASSLKKVGIAARLTGQLGERPQLTFATADGRSVQTRLDHPLEPALTAALQLETVQDKLARLGDTPYQLASLSLQIPEGTTLPYSSLNRGRRDAVQKLALAAQRSHPVVDSFSLNDRLIYPTKAPPAAGLFVTCRSLAQADAALQAGASGLYLDFLTLTGLGPALRELRSRSQKCLGVALPRIRKPGEDKIDTFVRNLRPDIILLRSLGSLESMAAQGAGHAAPDDNAPPQLIADFSLNVTNTLAALEILGHRLCAFTPSYDLDAAQLQSLVNSPLGPYAEVVVHHPMPLFHMEHCVIAALLSKGHDHRDCGRPCDRHAVSLRDRKGVDLPVEADIGCRNTVFHGIAQSAAEQVVVLRNASVRRYRIELVRETAAQTRAIVAAYRDLLEDRSSPVEVRRKLDALGLRTVRGTLRVIG